jgi:hypothetical protein
MPLGLDIKDSQADPGGVTLREAWLNHQSRLSVSAVPLF